MDSMGDRMKEYEQLWEEQLPKGSLWVMRLDGHGFSKFTKKIGAVKPFDTRLMRVMEVVSYALLEKFNFVTVFSQSDEITCIPNLRPENDLSEPIYNLRIQKLCSLVAAYATVVFYKEFCKQFPGMEDMSPTFDARIFAVPTEAEVFNAVLWRQRDCVKNSKNLVGQEYFSHKRLQGLTADQQIALVFEETGVQYLSYPADFRLGVLVKKVLTPMTGLNPFTKEDTYYERGVPTSFSFALDPSYTDWILRKYA